MLVYYQHTTHPSPSAGYIRAFYYITGPHALEEAGPTERIPNRSELLTYSVQNLWRW